MLNDNLISAINPRPGGGYLYQVKAALPMMAGSMSADGWIDEQQALGDKTALFRRYAAGDHRANLTPEMRRSLRINDTTLSEMNDNYCGTVIETMLDRIVLRTVEADTQEAMRWCEEVLEKNRIDALQVDVHGAALRDGNAYVLVDVATDRDGERYVRLTHEPAFDGRRGMCVLYEANNARTPMLAVKIWQTTTDEYADTLRVNVYWPDRIEYWRGIGTEILTRQSVERWVDASGVGLGVPVVHFRNKTAGYTPFGMSEIEAVVPLQDALNRTLYSMIATAENTAFPIRALIGDEAPQNGLYPGMMLSFFTRDSNGNPSIPKDESAIKWLQSIRLEQFTQGELVPYLDQASWLKGEIFAVSNTPSEDIRSNVSGESLKQREVKLLGKVQRFEAHAGNCWEDVMALAHRVETAFIDMPPAYEELRAKWQDAQLRNNAQQIENAEKMYAAGLIDQRTALKEVAHIFGWTEREIDAIMIATERERGVVMDTRQASRAQSAASAFDANVPTPEDQRMSEANAQSQPA